MYVVVWEPRRGAGGRRVARICKIITEETQPKQHVRLRMTLRRSLVWRKCKRIYRIHALDANSSHFKRLICFNYIRATRCRLPPAFQFGGNIAVVRIDLVTVPHLRSNDGAVRPPRLTVRTPAGRRAPRSRSFLYLGRESPGRGGRLAAA